MNIDLSEGGNAIRHSFANWKSTKEFQNIDINLEPSNHVLIVCKKQKSFWDPHSSSTNDFENTFGFRIFIGYIISFIFNESTHALR